MNILPRLCLPVKNYKYKEEKLDKSLILTLFK